MLGRNLNFCYLDRNELIDFIVHIVRHSKYDHHAKKTILQYPVLRGYITRITLRERLSAVQTSDCRQMFLTPKCADLLLNTCILVNSKFVYR